MTSEEVVFDQQMMKRQVSRRCVEEGCLWQGPWGVKGGDAQRSGWEWSSFGVLARTQKARHEGPVSGGGNGDCANEPRVGFSYLQCTSLQSSTACKLVQSFLSPVQLFPQHLETGKSPAVPGILGTLWECRYLPYSRNTR